MSISNQWAWVSFFTQPIFSSLTFPRCIWSRVVSTLYFSLTPNIHIQSLSSAKDQLTGASVAIKKIMKPFSTPVLSKRTYRELKLLKHIQHENVSCTYLYTLIRHLTLSSDHQPQRCLHFTFGRSVSFASNQIATRRH